jgi:hypothetical protein
LLVCLCKKIPSILLAFVRAKFDVGADVLTLSERFLHAAEIGTLPVPFRGVG